MQLETAQAVMSLHRKQMADALTPRGRKICSAFTTPPSGIVSWFANTGPLWEPMRISKALGSRRVTQPRRCADELPAEYRSY
jgi:hypothetical protein